MNLYSIDNNQTGVPSRGSLRRWTALFSSLAILIGFQLLSHPTSIAILTKIERRKTWLIPITTLIILSLGGLGIYTWLRPFSDIWPGFQILGITAVSSVIAVGYRSAPSSSFDESLRRAKWLIVLALLNGMKAIHFLTQARNKKVVLKGLALVTLLIAALWYHQPILEMAALLQNQDAVVAYLNQYGPLAPVALSAALILQVFIAAIPGHILMLGGGYVYGFWAILTISIITTVGASQLAFLLAKWAGRPVVERLAPRQVLDKWRSAADENGMVFFMFAFMLPIFPADILNYVAGLSPISGKRFFVANLLGRLPGLILLSLLGANGLTLTPQLVLVVTAVGLLMFVGWYYLFVVRKNRFLS